MNLTSEATELHPANKSRVRVAHIISGLFGGGAERMLFRLLIGSDTTKFDHTVISLTSRGDLGDEIENLGISVIALGMRPGNPDPSGLLRLRKELKASRVDVIQTWMYHADLLGGLAALGLRIPVIWNIRADIAPFSEDKKTYLITRLCASLSRLLPARIICCSNTARRSHERLGYDASRLIAIRNGFEVPPVPTEAERTEIRAELQLAENALVIGFVTRDDPRKDLRTFFKAAAMLHRESPLVNFVLCGKGIDWDNQGLASMVEAAGIREVCHLLGRRDDVQRVMSVFDVATLTSSSEAFPNVVGEAMSSGIPVVSTAAGDSAEIVGDTGITVPISSAEELSEGWSVLLRLSPRERAQLGDRARRRIEEKFSLRSTVAAYEALYLDQLQAKND